MPNTNLTDVDDSKASSDAELREHFRALITNEIISPTSHSASQSLACLILLRSIVSNLILNPSNELYRRIKCTSQSFKTKLEPVDGSVIFLRSIGFEKKVIEFVGYYICTEASIDYPSLHSAKTELDIAVRHIEGVCAAKERMRAEEKGEDARRLQQVRQAIQDDKNERRERRQERDLTNSTGISSYNEQ